MPSLHVIEQGSQLSVERQRLLVRKKGELLARAPLAHTDAVMIYGNVSVTTPAIKRMMHAGVDIVFLTTNGRFVGRMVGPFTKFGTLRASQYACCRDPGFVLPVAKAIVQGKLLNMRTLLLRHNRELERPEVTQAARRLARLAAQADTAKDPDRLLGIEGSGSAAYFGAFGVLLKHGWVFAKRARRPPPDPVNVLLSLGYTLLAQTIEGAVSMVGLDPYLGVLHTPVYGRPSLALDLVEEFRAIVVDSTVLRCLNESMIVPGDFTPGTKPARPVVLCQDGMRRFISAFETRLATEIRHPISGDQMTYRRVFETQVRLMARCFRDAHPDYRPFRVR